MGKCVTVKFQKSTHGDISNSSSYDLICCLIIHTTDKRYSKNYHTQLLDMYFSFHLHQNEKPITQLCKNSKDNSSPAINSF